MVFHSFLENKQQRVKINGSFSTFKYLALGVPQGSVLGPLSFNIYINDLLLSIPETDICNYADDTTIYACHKNIDNVIWSLENDSTVLIQWFSLPQDLRNTESLSLFKSKINKWHGEDCSCRLCRPFIPKVEFL